MTAHVWDERTDPVTEQWRDERALYLLATPWWLAREAAASTRLDRDADGTWSLPEANRCEGCGEPVSAQDWADFDGHGPQCPRGDPACELRVCDGVHADPTSHTVCETQVERDTAAALARDEALREQWAEWHEEDGL